VSVPPRISVLLPTHNRGDVLHCAIQSVLAQTLPDFELLVVGDGCTDDTAAVVRGVGDARIRWFDLPKAPAFGYANRNIALREARAGIIAYLAHDDLWLPDHLELIVRCFESASVEFAYSRALDVSIEGHITPSVFNLEDLRTQERWLTWWEGYLPIACVAHRAACLGRYGYWNEQMSRGADWELWMRIFEGGQRRNLAFLPTPTCLHFVAGWRRERHTRRWATRMKSRAGAQPELTVATPAGMTQQQAVLRVLMDGGAESIVAMRRAAQIELDRNANIEFPLLAAIHLLTRIRRTLWRRRANLPGPGR
jgi:glycosyltransferase involved in cell wall biosynthesis